ncbi:carboxymethylenebutenolidase [Sphingomonas spermidinifaciens]|uniref:Carboxymethylenebutenolidase n=1 Tax=Sphingomonas spermidinifaciens TaxID=1141889 RepID=A0A2A4B1J4_9SPHN|nr:dienelactone hydrolase family protein [Sphingomonas spermidinifaciens]PCD01940.1 carboxymethylenebutenolidase [Sphingomonas spermidinifaciens]
MAIQRRELVYDGPGGPFEGVLAFDPDAGEARPGVLIVPNVLGQKEADNLVAERLAALGYVGLAADVFGQGKRTTRESPDPARYMNQLNADRPLLRDRLHASLAALKAQPEVDPARTAAIGYCFGGKCVLDLARSGADLRAVVSFHGIFDRPSYANVTPIAPRILVCHGWADPLAPPESAAALTAELTEGGARWQLHAYGHAGHGFTDRSMQGSTRPGFGYDADADASSWAAMQRLLAEALA